MGRSFRTHMALLVVVAGLGCKNEDPRIVALEAELARANTSVTTLRAELAEAKAKPDCRGTLGDLMKDLDELKAEQLRLEKERRELDQKLEQVIADTEKCAKTP
ncbi:MAG: hypothetical protein H6711_02740 [Myxococcales bacterium]|nr:hypothetical protein [Myxococcales bacterium]